MAFLTRPLLQNYRDTTWSGAFRLLYQGKSGEPGGIRTHDQWIKSPVLYR